MKFSSFQEQGWFECRGFQNQSNRLHKDEE